MKKLTKNLVDRFRHSGQWYKDIVEYIRKTYDDPDLFAGLLAATSPRKTVKENWKLANRIYREFKAGKPYSRQGLMPCHIGNIERALSGLELSGNKVRAFCANLRGDFNAVTVDVWVLRWFGHSKDSPSDRDYIRISDKIRRISKRIDETPAATQAIIWTIARFCWGEKPSSFTAETKQGLFEFAKE